MDLLRARSDLKAQRFSQIEWVDLVGSTNAVLSTRARDGASEQVLGAEFQTAGRGRRDRSWVASSGSAVLMSVLVRPRIEREHFHLITTAMGLAVLDAVEGLDAVERPDAVETLRARVSLKWPNDLIAIGTDGHQHGKVAGMLSEAVFSGDGLSGAGLSAEAPDAVVVGIGINVSMPSDVPDEVAATAAWLDQLTPSVSAIDRTELVVSLLESFERQLDSIETAKGRAEVMARYRGACHSIGQHVRVELQGREGATSAVGGVATDIDDDGQIVVDVGGELMRFSVADVVHLRKA